MRICFVCSEYPPGPHGGIGSLIQTLARAMIIRGHEVRVIGVYSSTYIAQDYEEDQGVKVWRLRECNLPKIGWIVSRIKLFRTIVKWIKDWQVEIIDVPDYQGWSAGWSSLSVPVVARLNGSASVNAKELHRLLRPLEFWLEKTALKRADYICSASQVLAARTQDLFDLGRTMEVIYNPVKVSPILPVRSPVFGKVIFFGTLNRNKGIIELLSAWDRVKKSCPQASLHVYGKDWQMEDGRSMQEYLRLRFSSELKANVFIKGFVSRDVLLRDLSTASVVVLPSKVEAFGLAAVESMSIGCPTVFTQRASGPEIINDGDDGLLVDPDSPREISDAIIRIIQNENLAIRLGKAGWEKAKNKFSTNVIIPINEIFYAKCIDLYRKKNLY